MFATSIYILMDYQVESYSTFGLVALVVMTPMLFIYMFALMKFKKD